MTPSNPTPERPPWPDDMEEALMRHRARVLRDGGKPESALGGRRIRNRIARWVMCTALVVFTLWLLCEVVTA